jgi:acyl-CoA thioesterase
MSDKTYPELVTDAMMAKDAFSQWLGIRRLEDGEGLSVLQMEVREDMVNGFGIAHGGITFSLADSAFAFASNSHGRHAVSIEISISHTKPVYVGDVLLARASLIDLSERLGRYQVKVINQKSEVVALFYGTVYRKKDRWEV